MSEWIGGGRWGIDESEVAQTRFELRRLAEDERAMLRGVDIFEAEEIREQFYQQKMELISHLPPSLQKRYGGQLIQRMGVVRKNVNMEMDEEEQNRPVFTLCVFLTSVIMLLLALRRGDFDFASWTENPFFGVSTAVLSEMGAKSGKRIVVDGEWWRLLTPLVLYAGLVDFVLGSIVLIYLVWAMEVAFGTMRIAAIFITSGAFGVMTSAIFLPNTTTVAGCAPLMGLLGALVGDFLQNHTSMLDGRCSYLSKLLLGTAMGLVMGLFPLVDNFTHVAAWFGGILGGTTLFAGVLKDADGNAITGWRTAPLAVFAFMLQIAMFVSGLYLLYVVVDTSGWCAFCVSVSCASGPWDCPRSM